MQAASTHFSLQACLLLLSFKPQAPRQGPIAQKVQSLLMKPQVPDPPSPLPLASEKPGPPFCGLIKGTWGWDLSGRVKVFALCIFVGCLKGGGASDRIGIDVSGRLALGRRTKDFPERRSDLAIVGWVGEGREERERGLDPAKRERGDWEIVLEVGDLRG